MHNPSNVVSIDRFPEPVKTGVIILAGGLGTRLTRTSHTHGKDHPHPSDHLSDLAHHQYLVDIGSSRHQKSDQTGCGHLSRECEKYGLGYSGPKGCLQLPGGKTLYQTLLERCQGLPVAIMTSPHTHEETAKHVPGVDLFMQDVPDGNGKVFHHFFDSPIPGTWDVDALCVLPVDNRLAVPFRPKLELDVAAITAQAGEKVGRLYEEQGKLFCCEYMENPPQELIYGYSGIFACSIEFAQRVSRQPLPAHSVEKNDKEKVEYFVFDTFHHAKEYRLLCPPREQFFAPIKTRNDIPK